MTSSPSSSSHAAGDTLTAIDAFTADDAQLDQAIEAYLAQHFNQMRTDLEALVSIPSFVERERAQVNAPFGPGPRAALNEVIRLADSMGFETTDCEGYLAFADWPKESPAQLGIICHTDVVPAGPGWHFEPFALTEHDGYLVGRGVIDDKGPLVVCLHALKFWKDAGASFPFSVRFLFGADEEVGMSDVHYYRTRFADPDFLFTPDAEFPVCYGEKGIFQAVIQSKKIPDGAIIFAEGGTATNAVAGTAHALVRTPSGEQREFFAEGHTAHASTPDLGNNALGALAHELLESNVLCPDEALFFALVERLCTSTDGSAFRINCSDADFGSLTMCGGKLSFEDGVFRQTIDIRFPTSIDTNSIVAILQQELTLADATLCDVLVKEPFLINADDPAINALLKAYTHVTQQPARPFTMGGGTYAREFSRAASFGMEMPEAAHPAWVGSMHGPDEAISIEELRLSFKIFVYALRNLALCESITS